MRRSSAPAWSRSRQGNEARLDAFKPGDSLARPHDRTAKLTGHCGQRQPAFAMAAIQGLFDSVAALQPIGHRLYPATLYFGDVGVARVRTAPQAPACVRRRRRRRGKSGAAIRCPTAAGRGAAHPLRVTHRGVSVIAGRAHLAPQNESVQPRAVQPGARGLPRYYLPGRPGNVPGTWTLWPAAVATLANCASKVNRPSSALLEKRCRASAKSSPRE